jgi:hypothetical protein
MDTAIETECTVRVSELHSRTCLGGNDPIMVLVSPGKLWALFVAKISFRVSVEWGEVTLPIPTF